MAIKSAKLIDFATTSLQLKWTAKKLLKMHVWLSSTYTTQYWQVPPWVRAHRKGGGGLWSTCLVEGITRVLLICKPDRTAFLNITILIDNYNCTIFNFQSGVEKTNYVVFLAG